MRIAQVAPLFERVPPRLYGGTERIVAYLTDELLALGHDVTLFASGDSITKARLFPVGRRALRLDGTVVEETAPHILMSSRSRSGRPSSTSSTSIRTTCTSRSRAACARHMSRRSMGASTRPSWGRFTESSPTSR